MAPIPGPPLCTLTYTIGIRADAQYDTPSLYSEMPQDEDETSKAVAAWLLPELEEKLLEKLKENGQIPLLRETEIPLAQVLADMELTGFEVDKTGIYDFGKALETDIEKITEEIYEETGYQFNLNSPKQLGVILYDKLGLKYTEF